KIDRSNEVNKKIILHARKAKTRSDSAEIKLRTNSDKTAALEDKLRSTRSEIVQLNELWEEKYPYDRTLADKIETEKDLTQTMRKLERELKALGTYNLGALSEDEFLLERTDFLSEQLEDVRTARDELTLLIEETDKQVETIFMTALRNIDKRFDELFHRLFGGGEARLQIQEADNIWDRGVEIYARPPGKQLHNINQLSGGEQSLTAIAHLFASLEVAGVPLAVLDEVDAALDEYNLIRFASLAKEYSKTIQLIVMTHRRTTMEQADIIYGVTMVEPGLSRIVGIDIEDYK
ncbi:MAG: chromosome segregation protein SMC, partial [Synergistaceae bacterium]|nr:chromosome segregation protein SMC [Synergistaceae bacterium]